MTPARIAVAIRNAQLFGRVEAQNAQLLELDAAKDRARPMTTTTRPERPPRVLVVDDELTMREFLEMGLGCEGFEVRTATGGASSTGWRSTLTRCPWDGRR